MIEFLDTKERVGQVDDIQEEELPVKDALKGIAKNKWKNFVADRMSLCGRILDIPVFYGGSGCLSL